MLCLTIARNRHKSMIAEYQQAALEGAPLVELCLDSIHGSVNLKRLLEVKATPVLISCRRQADGGHWAGTESERQVLLRSAIVSGVDYVDLEWDIAKMIPRYGSTKRVISYINQQETPGNLSEILQNILECDPDIVRIATKANNLNDWLRVSLLIKRAPKPTTAICLGELGMATRLLGERWGSPLTFTMSPLGRKLQPWEVSWGDIRHVYGIEHINQETELFALVGSEVQRSHEIVMLNALMRKLQLNACCMPLKVLPEDWERLVNVCPELGFKGLLVSRQHQEAVVPLMSQMEATADGIGAVNTIVFNGNRRIGYNTYAKPVIECLSVAMEIDLQSDRPFKGRRCLILGHDALSKAVAWELQDRGAEVLLSSPDSQAAARLARTASATAVEWDKRLEVPTEVVFNGTMVGTFPNVDASPFEVTSLYPGMVVVETVYNPEQTLLVKQAKQAGCKVILGAEVFVRQLAYQFRLFTNREPPLVAMRNAIKKLATI